MKTVGDILKEIDALEKQHNIMSNMANTMASDNEVAKYMFEKMKIDKSTIQEIASTLLTRRYNLEGQLKAIEVNVK